MKFNAIILTVMLTVTTFSQAKTKPAVVTPASVATTTVASSTPTSTPASAELPLDHQQADLQMEYDKLQAQAAVLDLVLSNLGEYKQLKTINAQLEDLVKRNKLLQNKKQEAAQKAQAAQPVKPAVTK